MNPQFLELIAVVGTGIASTIGVCVWLLKTQQAERERTEERSTRLSERMFGMLDERIREQTNVLREVSMTQRELSSSIRELTERIENMEQHHPPSKPRYEVKDGNLPPGA